VEAVRVQILGTDYFLRSSGNEEQLHIVAATLDEKLKEILAASKNLPILSATVLVALNLTNELLQLQEAQENVLQDIEKRLDQILASFEQR
jgi:cell division protein ZapA (FtsZ GTPase activity inhibitor)